MRRKVKLPGEGSRASKPTKFINLIIFILMTQKHDKEAAFESKLCIKCTEMYGNPVFDDMCSVCFKKEKAIQKLEELQQIEQQPPTPKLPSSTEVKPEVPELESKKREAPSTEVPNSESGRCLKCNKKTKMLGYCCKHCNKQFCKFHRLPQDHDCEVDFVSLGRKQIKSDNPLVSHQKIQQI